MERRLLLSLLLYGLILAGLGTLHGALLALALPLAIYLGAALLGRPEEPRLQVTRSHSAERAAPGAPIAVKLSVTNAGARLAEVLLEDLVPSTLTVVEGAPSLLTALAPGASVELEYTVSGQRGIYHFAGVQATARDPLGLFRAQVVCLAPGQLFVVPEAARLRRIDIRPRRTSAYAGLIPARQGGPGVEFFGVREYQPGDPTRWINGRATARHPQTLFVNEFEQERVTDVGVIVDARSQSDAQTAGGALFEHAVEAAATLADAFLHRGNRVGLLLYGYALDWTVPGYGKVQRERILRALARAHTGDLPVFEKLDFIPTRLFPARSQLALISSLLPHDLEALIRLRALGYHLLVVSPDPIAFERGQGGDRAAELAARIGGLERALLLRKLAEAGIQVIDWQVETPFLHVAQTALSRSPLWLRSLGIA